MKTLFTFILVFALAFASTVSAETFLFGGGGADFKAFNSPDGYDIDKNWGFSGGIVKTFTDRISSITTYDYVVTEGTNPEGETSTVYEREVLVSASYLLNDPTAKFQVRLLGGLEITDSNVPEYGTFLSFANGFALNYRVTDNGMSVFGASTFSFSDDYYDAKVRVGLSYPVGGLVGGLF